MLVAKKKCSDFVGTIHPGIELSFGVGSLVKLAGVSLFRDNAFQVKLACITIWEISKFSVRSVSLHTSKKDSLKTRHMQTSAWNNMSMPS